MAHIFDLAGQIDLPAYSDGKKSGTKVKFPTTPVFSGFNLPSRIEADIFDLEFTGQIPPEINGTFYRIQPGEFGSHLSLSFKSLSLSPISRPDMTSDTHT